MEYFREIDFDKVSYKLQIQNSIDYIEKHKCENIKLGEIAKQSHFSEFHFHRLFHKTVGVFKLLKYSGVIETEANNIGFYSPFMLLPCPGR